MYWEAWKPRYEHIVSQLGLNKKADENAARTLNGLLPPPDPAELKKLVRGRECVVFGAGPSLDSDLEKLERAGYLSRVLVTADGATSAVLRYRNPEIIVTDLDGDVDDQLRAWRRGSWMVVHAHGDNIQQVRKVVPKLNERVIGTTQARPFGKLFNFGGFTDGDRAVFIAHEFGASKIYLSGMDLSNVVGKYSGKKDPKRKFIKLEICGELLSWLASQLGAPMVNLTTGGKSIRNIPKKVVEGATPLPRFRRGASRFYATCTEGSEKRCR
ncbi:MAG TPA: DUF115 domain-containing protein [Hadesarchaea archaeon]|nr:DUF115 domain-containing protein [Hadesarchaea archaeon]